MAIQHDENGFLVGEPIQDIKRVSKNTSALLKEVRDIKKALGIKPNDTQPRPVNPPAPSANNSNNGDNESPQSRSQSNRTRSNAGSQSGNESGNNQQSQNSRNSSSSQAGNSGASSQSGSNAGNSGSQSVNPSPSSESYESDAQPTPRQRDARGRFLSNNDNTIDAGESSTGNGGRQRNSRGQFMGGNGLDKDTKDGGNGLRGMFDSLGDRITTALDTQGLEEVDPTVKAFQETVEPLAKGYQFLFGGNNKKDKPYFAWFGKLWNTLKSINKNTAKNSGGESGGGLFSGLLGGLIGKALPFIATALGFIFGPVALGIGVAAIAAWGLFSKTGREFFANLGSNIAAAWQWSINAFSEYVIPALVSAWDFAVKTFNEQIVPALSASWDWFTQQAIDTWNGFTAWLSEDLPQVMSDAWDSITGFISDQWGEALKGLKPVFDAIGKTWDSFMESAKGGWDALINTFNALYDGLKKIPVIGDAIQAAEDAVKVAKEAAESAKQAVESKVSGAVDNVKSAYNSTVEAVSRKGGAVVDTVKSAHAKAVDWTSRNVVEPVAGALGSLSSKYEGKVGSANKDNIGHAYGKYQFNSKTGGLDRFFKDNPEYEKRFSGIERDSPEFYAKWKELAKTDKAGFEAAQDRSAANLWYDPAKEKAESLGFDMNNRGVQEAVFSGSIQHGGIKKLLSRVAKKNDLKSMTPDQQVKAFYDERRKYVEENLSGKVLAAQEKRYDNEEKDAYRLASSSVSPEQIAAAAPKSPSVAASTIAVSNPAPVMPSMPKSPKIAEANPTILPLISKDSRGAPMPIMVSEIGQDLPDRKLAHIATGGISGS